MLACTSHHKPDAQAPWCAHEFSGITRHFHLYFNPKECTTLLQVAQAIDLYQTSTHAAVPGVRDYSFEIQSFIIRGVCYDKGTMQSFELFNANELLGDGDVFNFQAKFGGAGCCNILWSVNMHEVNVVTLKM